MRSSPLPACAAFFLAGCGHFPPAAPPPASSAFDDAGLAADPEPESPPAPPAPGAPAAPSLQAKAAPAALGAGPGPRRPEKVDEIRAAVEAVLRTQADSLWRAWTTGAKSDPAEAWKGREAILTRATLAQVGRALAAAQGDDRRALQYLRNFLVGEILAREIAEPSAHLASARATATFSWNGRPVPLREVPALLAAESDALRRRSIAAAAAPVSARLGPLAQAREEKLSAAARALGWESTLALAADLRGAAPDALARLASSVLARTENLYRSLLDDLARRDLSLSFDSLRAHDLPRLLLPAADEETFPAARAFDDATAAIAGLGLDLGRQRPIRIGTTARPEKSPRPLALPVEVPTDVRLSSAPAGGLDAVGAILHELGAAEFYAHVTSPVMEFRRLGPSAIPEAWAQLVEGIAETPEWLASRGLGGERLRDALQAGAARRLHAVRSAAARVLLEVERAKAPARTGEIWAAVSARAFGHAGDSLAPGWQLEGDPLLRAADDLRARLLAAQAEKFLTRAAKGEPWWRSREAGEILRRTWPEGTRALPEERSAAMGYPALDAEALESLLRARAGITPAG